MNSEIAPHIWIPEPKLSFHPDRESDRDIILGILTVLQPHNVVKSIC